MRISDWSSDVCSSDLLQSGQRVAATVRVHCGHRALVARIHCLEHVERLARPHLADDDAVGAHAQRVLDQPALQDLALALDVGGPRLHAGDVDLLELQLGGRSAEHTSELQSLMRISYAV